MTAEKFKRKLAAILGADVKGYSHLMGKEEEGTLRALSAYKALMEGFTPLMEKVGPEDVHSVVDRVGKTGRGVLFEALQHALILCLSSLSMALMIYFY